LVELFDEAYLSLVEEAYSEEPQFVELTHDISAEELSYNNMLISNYVESKKEGQVLNIDEGGQIMHE
jgi:hypothetical protein